MIEIEELSKAFGRQQVLREVGMNMERGQSIALIGPNGSGKTTLIKILLGLVIPDSGTVKVNGQSIAEGPQYREHIGYMPQISRFPDQMSISQLFAMIRRMRTGYASEDYDLDLYEEFSIGEIAHKKLGNLSGGMRQQVSAALAFYFRPSIVILDEPTAGLDPVSNEALKGKINKSAQEDRVVLTTSHILNDLDDIANQVAYLMKGELQFFKPLDVLRQETSETKLNKIIVSMINS